MWSIKINLIQSYLYDRNTFFMLQTYRGDAICIWDNVRLIRVVQRPILHISSSICILIVDRSPMTAQSFRFSRLRHMVKGSFKINRFHWTELKHLSNVQSFHSRIDPHNRIFTHGVDMPFQQEHKFLPCWHHLQAKDYSMQQFLSLVVSTFQWIWPPRRFVFQIIFFIESAALTICWLCQYFNRFESAPWSAGCVGISLDLEEVGVFGVVGRVHE